MEDARGQRSRMSRQAEVLCSKSAEHHSVSQIDSGTQSIVCQPAHRHELKAPEVLTSTGANERLVDSCSPDTVRNIYDAG